MVRPESQGIVPMIEAAVVAGNWVWEDWSVSRL
jgi:hypothetical protein